MPASRNRQAHLVSNARVFEGGGEFRHAVNRPAVYSGDQVFDLAVGIYTFEPGVDSRRIRQRSGSDHSIDSKARGFAFAGA